MNEQEKKHYEQLYEQLSQQYTAEEMAEAFVFPSDLSKEEEAEAREELQKLRAELKQNMTPAEQMRSSLLGLRFRLENSLNQPLQTMNEGLAHFLKAYLAIVGKEEADLAHDLAIHQTELKDILQGKKQLSLLLAYRLDGHAEGVVPALLWWKLAQKETEKAILDGKLTEAKHAEIKQLKQTAFTPS